MHKHAAILQAHQPSVTQSWCSRLIGGPRSCSTLGAHTQAVLPGGATHGSVTHTPQASVRQTWPSAQCIYYCPSSTGSSLGRLSRLSAAAKGARTHPMDPPVTSSKHSSTFQPLGQCMLLAMAAVGATPALLLLDIAEQSVMGLGLLTRTSQAASPSRHQQAQQQMSQLVHHHQQLHEQQQQQQQQQQLHEQQQHSLGQQQQSHGGQQQQQRPGQQQQQLPAMPVGYAGRPFLPLWPPLLPMVLAVAPLGLLLWPGCRQTLTGPLLLLGASLAVQAYINLVVVVCTRVSARSAATGAPAAWAGLSTSKAPAAAADSTAAGGACGQGGGALSAAAVKVFAGLQLLCDVLRVACCALAAWLAVHAVSAGASAHWCRALQHAGQQCFGAGDLSVVVAAASAGAAALQQLVAVWWGPACIVALCSASAAVHALSCRARCNVLVAK